MGSMRVVSFSRYGDESVLAVREVAAPTVGADEVLVRVSDASLNPVDFKLRQGMLRWLRMPRLPAITGKDFAGTIEAIGSNVKGYSVGDRVFGSVDPMKGRGACAEFVALSTELIAKTPESVTDEVAACLPVASGTALQALRDCCLLSAGQSVLITGASGAVGASGVQIAKHLGAKVTGVCSSSNVEYVRSIGADRVVDYKSSDWTTMEEQFDVVFDAAASNTLGQAKKRLTERGW
jgi:NADPH:quinone reductase-like Zn-dependent oxidoreductase